VTSSVSLVNITASYRIFLFLTFFKPEKNWFILLYFFKIIANCFFDFLLKHNRMDRQDLFDIIRLQFRARMKFSDPTQIQQSIMLWVSFSTPSLSSTLLLSTLIIISFIWNRAQWCLRKYGEHLEKMKKMPRHQIPHLSPRRRPLVWAWSKIHSLIL
jgi:hypothetical protein